jgi:uncharacterized protein
VANITTQAALGQAQRVVVDTNVWISAALSGAGAPAQVLRRVLQVGVVVFSKATFAELEARLWKPKFDRYISLDARRAILRDANAAAHWVEVAADIASVAYCRDADDDKFIHAALAASTQWLVTGDQDLLVLQSVQTVQILSPAAALKREDFCHE